MKGLLIKDIKLLQQQKRYLLLMAVLTVVFNVMDYQQGMRIGFPTFLGALLTLTTFSYDEHENGYAYLFVLPVLRKDYVQEKYLLGFSTTTLFWIGAMAINQVVNAGKRGQDFGEVLGEGGAVLLVILLYLALLIPIQIKYGVEKGRMVLMLASAVVVLFFVGLYHLMEGKVAQVDQWIMAHQGESIGVMVAIVLVIFFFSYQKSTKYMMQKEF